MSTRDGLLRGFSMALLSLSILAYLPGEAAGQTASTDERSFLLGTGSTEGTFHPVGVALSTLVKLKLLPSDNVDLNALNTDGSEENVDLMRRGKVQLGIVSALTGHEASKGVGRFADVGADENLRAITTLWSSTDHVIVGQDSVQSGTIDDVVAMRGKRMSLGRDLSGTLLENRAMLAPLGIDIGTDFDRVELDYGESALAFLGGEVDGVSLSGALPVIAVQQIFDEAGDKAAILEVNDEQLAVIDQGRRVWSRAVIPANTYRDQSRDIFTIGTPNILAVRADVDEEVVYQITKTIFENLDYLHGLHKATNQISLDTAVSNLPLPVHEGALRYFEEKGVELPTPPIEVSPDLLARFENTADARDALNQGTISLFTGTSGGTSARIADELASALNGRDYGFRLLPTHGGGHAQNLTDLLYMQGVDSALVHTDVVAYAEEQAIYPDVTGKIAYLTEMFPEEVHLVVAEGIDNILTLRGKKVDVGRSGSGTDITASIILSKLDIPVQMTGFGGYAALDKLKKGEIAGAFFIGGKPLPMLREIAETADLRLLPIPFVQFADSYRPASIRHQDYPGLVDAAGDDLATMAVRTALVTYEWRPGTARFQALSRFSNAFFDRLRDLHREGYHPKWWEVDPTAEINGWERFAAASDWITSNALAAKRIALEGQYLVEEAALESFAAETSDPSAATLSIDAALSPDKEVEVEATSNPAEAEDDPASTPTGVFSIDAISEAEAAEPAAEEPPAPSSDSDTADSASQTLQPTTAESLRRLRDSKTVPSLSSTSINPLPKAGVTAPTF